jgi:lambda family phage portal protein
MKLTLLDQALLPLAPQRVAARLKARMQVQALSAMGQSGLTPSAISGNEDFTGGGTQPNTGLRWWRPWSRDAAGDTLRDLSTRRAQARELVQDNPIAAGALQTVVDRVVGTGLALVPMPDRRALGWSAEQAEAWKRQVQTEFSMWADSRHCTMESTQNFYERQALTLRTALESGDAFTVLPDAQSPGQPYRLRLQLLEADRVGNPMGRPDTVTEAGGVRFGDGGAPQSCHIYRAHPGAVLTGGRDRFAGEWIDFAGPSGRLRVLHHMRHMRPGQPRGVPWLKPVVSTLKQIGRYTEAEIQAAVVSAFLTLVIETADAGPSPAPVFGATEEDVAASEGEISMGPGAVIGLAKGEKANVVNPQRPNPAFEPFVAALFTQVGMALGVPHELLTKRFNASYSASKAALLDAWVFFRGMRSWLSASLCQPAYETWMAEAVIRGRVAAPGFFSDPLMRWAYTRAAWHGDSPGSINPKDEVAAYVAAIDARLMSRERAEWELGGTDWWTTLDAKAAEQQRLKELDLLPAPKAGAPAQPQDDSDKATAAVAAAMHEQAGAIAALAARPQAAPAVTVHQGDTHVHPAAVEVQAGDSHIHMPEGLVQLEASVAAPQVTVPVQVQAGDVHVDVPPAQVTVHQAAAVAPPPPVAMRQRIVRDAAGEMSEIINEPYTGEDAE